MNRFQKLSKDNLPNVKINNKVVEDLYLTLT